MTMNKTMIIRILIWLIVFTFMITEMCRLLTSANTIANVIGFIGLVAIIYLSYSTKLFTQIKIKLNKNEK